MLASHCRARPPSIQRHREDDDRAGDDLLDPVGSPCCEQPIWMIVMMAAPAMRPGDRPAAASQAAAADDHRGDHVELQAHGDRGIAHRQASRTASRRRARRARRRACRRRSCVRVIAHAAQARRPLVGPDREDMTAESGVAQASAAIDDGEHQHSARCRPAAAAASALRRAQQIVQPRQRAPRCGVRRRGPSRRRARSASCPA